jgi:peptide/nickel transport system substrate-binding protein
MQSRGLPATLALALLCCGPREPDAVPAARDDLRIAVRADVAGFFPDAGVNESFTVQVNGLIFETLTRFDDRLQLAPGLAARWESPDDRTYRFDLRPGARFADGRRLTAHDVVASLEANRAGWVTRDYLQAVESVRALDETRVEIRTRTPYLALLTRLPWAYVVPRAALRGSGSGAAPSVVGSGPYRLVEWRPGEEIRLARNPHWGGPSPDFADVSLRVMPDAAARVAAVEKGEADVADQVPLAEIERLSRDPRLRVVERSGLRVLFLALRVDRPPFSDPRVREALDLALDRRELSRRALQGRAEPATQLVPPSIVGYDPGLRATAVDRGRARALLHAAGAEGLAFRLDGPNNRYVNDREILAELARQLGEIGLRVEASAIDKRDFFPLIESGGSAAHLVGYACESGDAGDVLNSMLHSARGGPLGSLNSLGVADEALDALIAEADAARTDDARARSLRAALQRATQLRAALPLVIQTEAVLLGPRVAWDPPLNLALRPERMKRR